jgi:raffinose/stachyose/melibiose transport system permease protein
VSERFDRTGRAARSLAEFGRYAVLVLALVVAAYPVFWMVTTGAKGPGQASDWWGLPRSVRWQNFAEVWRAGESQSFFTYFANSVLVTVASVVLTVVIAAPAGFSLARLGFRGRGAVFVVFLSGMMVPVHVTLIPLLRFMDVLGLYDTRAGLVAVYVAFSLPVAVVLFTGFFREIPEEIEEAARLDGCGPWRQFLYIAAPLARPAVVGVAMLVLVTVWNEFVFALVLLQDPAKSTIPLGVQNLRGEFGSHVPLMAAALSVAVVPPLVVYALAQRHLIRGLTAGAVRG